MLRDIHILGVEFIRANWYSGADGETAPILDDRTDSTDLTI